MQTLSIGENRIRAIADERLKNPNLLAILVKQAWTEFRFKIRQTQNFRSRKNDAACQAYCQMTVEEFEAINARQAWANWRTIPKNLSQKMPSTPVVALDLCCGVGQSTEVLACYLPYGSRVIGIEYNPTFVERARSKVYLHQSGKISSVEFQAQSVLEPFRDTTGLLIASESVDIVNASGAVGCHFDEQASTTLAREIFRVLKPGGLATIDSGKAGTATDHLINIFQTLGFERSHQTKSCVFDRYTQVCFVKKAEANVVRQRELQAIGI